jgi:hypothetical protein
MQTLSAIFRHASALSNLPSLYFLYVTLLPCTNLLTYFYISFQSAFLDYCLSWVRLYIRFHASVVWSYLHYSCFRFFSKPVGIHSILCHVNAAELFLICFWSLHFSCKKGYHYCGLCMCIHMTIVLFTLYFITDLLLMYPFTVIRCYLCDTFLSLLPWAPRGCCMSFIMKISFYCNIRFLGFHKSQGSKHMQQKLCNYDCAKMM